MKRFKNVLYVAHSSGVVLKAFQQAVDLAERNNARLTVIFVMETIPSHSTEITPQMLRQVRMEELEASLEKLTKWAAGRIEIEGKILDGKPFLEIIRDVLRNGRDLVIKAAGGDSGASDWIFGTTDMHLLRKCPCPVWLIKSTEHTPIQSIMAAVDFNAFDEPGQDTAEPLNRIILELAGSLSFLERSELHVVHAWSAIGESMMSGQRTGFSKKEVDSYVDELRLQNHSLLSQLLGKARNWIGPETYDAVDLKTHVPKGAASEIIPELVRKLNIDLIIMGTVARTGISGFLIGNTAETILRQIDCSVLAVKPPGFVTPVTLEQ